MSCSTHAGFRRPGCTAPTCSLKGRELRASVSSLAAPLFQSRAVGVALWFTSPARTFPCVFPCEGQRFVFRLAPSLAVGVGHCAATSVRRA